MSRCGRSGRRYRRPSASIAFSGRRALAALLLLLLPGLATHHGLAATPGLPFTEDFSDTTLRDGGSTNADWSTRDQALLQAPRQRRFGAFGPDQVGLAITADALKTVALALGDVDGDGDLDLVAGSRGAPNRLYLNNGTDEPWDGVAGVDITNDAHQTLAVALGDVDGDGDLDLVAGNGGAANRLYLNNGTGDPWNGVAGVDITSDAHLTQAVALGDVDGDGDCDLVAGNGGAANRLYLNNGTADPWGGATGVEITGDAWDTRAVVLGDVDSDGDLDMVAGNALNPNRLYLNNGTADPWSGVPGRDITLDAHDTSDVALGDVDGDGDLDLVAGNASQPNRLYPNNGTADPWSGATGRNITTDDHQTRAVALGDVDRDGDLDLMTGNWGQATRLYPNNGTADPWSDSRGADVSGDADITEAVALGDVDGDGDLDLIAGNDGKDVLYSNGSASGNPWTAVAGRDITADADYTRDVALGDVDGDGDLDLVVGNLVGNRLYLNNGTIDPWAGVTGLEVWASAHRFALGDVDGDGDLDLIRATWQTPIHLLTNNGTANPWGGVTGIIVESELRNVTAVALRDVDGDGDLDLVAGNSEQTNRLYTNNGTATPWSGVTGVDITSDADATANVAFGDVDGDGDLDLLVANRLLQPNRLYLNNGTANPWNGVTGQNITNDGQNTSVLLPGDVDGDGDLDLVALNDSLPRLYMNDGTGTWWTSMDMDPVVAKDGALGDVDNDGDLDLVVAVSGRNRLFPNNGTDEPWSGVASLEITSDIYITLAMALGDVDGDGDLDLVAGNSQQPNRLYPNAGAPDLWTGARAADITGDAQDSRALAAGDVDGDGDVDLVVGNYLRQNRLYLNDGNDRPWDVNGGMNITGDAHATLCVALGDVDSDGDLDLVVGNEGQNFLYLNNGTANPWSELGALRITADSYDTRSVVLGDVDGDGDLDLVTGNHRQPHLLYVNDGAGNPWDSLLFGRPVTDDRFATRSLALGDVDGDGDLDLVSGDHGGPNRLYLNDGAGSPWDSLASGVAITLDAQPTESVALGDVDQDGDLDLVVGNDGEPVRAYWNNGTANPWSGVTGEDLSTEALQTLSVALADVDGDGDLDVVLGNASQRNRILWNDVATLVTDLADDVDLTTSVVAADFDGDGELEVAAGNAGAPNRWYRRPLHRISPSRATSLEVDATSSIVTNATLTAVATLPANTRTTYELSNTGGARWFQVRPGVQFVFPTSGSDLRWRAELESLSPALTPRVEQVQIESAFMPSSIGDRVWEDVDGDGVQDPGEPGLAAVVVLYDDGGSMVDVAVTDADGAYAFPNVPWNREYSLRFFGPPGYVGAPQDQGGDDGLDSDADAVTGHTPVFRVFDFGHHTRWDAGMVPFPACVPPDEPIYIYGMTRSDDGNDYPILHFMDPNQPEQVTGYNVYRSSEPDPPPESWPQLASDVVDMDEATPNRQWVDTTGDVSPSGIWYYQVTAHSHHCPPQSAEGPF